MRRSCLVGILLIALPLLACSAYVSSVALELAHLSDIAYETQAIIDAWSCNECKNIPIQNQKAFFNSVANIQGYAGYVPKLNVILLAFRGSVDTKNWIANLNTVSTTYNYPGCNNCRVHAGFNTAYNGVGPTVRSHIQNLQSLHRGVSIVVTGHSLGGAMAILATLDLHQLGAVIKEVYTFGQPRVGDSAFASFFQTTFPNTFRVINYADTVPHLPPSSFGFLHGGHEIWYNPRGMNNYNICASESPSCANSINVVNYSTNDHSLSQYLQMKAVNSAEDQSPLAINDQLINSIESREELKKVYVMLGELLREQSSLNHKIGSLLRRE